MFGSLHIKALQVLELWQQKGLWEAVKFSVFVTKVAVPVEMDLVNFKPPNDRFKEKGMELIDVSLENFKPGNYFFPVKSRREKIRRNLGKGYRAFLLLDGRDVIGDLWYVISDDGMSKVVHPDVSMFNLNLGPEDVYMYDLYITQERRQEVGSNNLLGSALDSLKRRGYRKAFGFFETDNIPALWMHRLLGYQELPRYVLRRFLFFRSATLKVKSVL